ncbi:MAG TPA: hypothetical protein PKX48_09400 [Planctomycetota bacterium]|nr:hypothetical protein [Planctomycetota bacterium]HPL60869.1 hypothetical protein [Planctomycetota bacterium]
MKKNVLLVVVALCAASMVWAQATGADFDLKMTPAATVLKAPVGATASGTVACGVVLDSRVNGLQGWSFGLKLEPAAGVDMNISKVALAQAALKAACGKAFGYVNTSYFASTNLAVPAGPVPGDGAAADGLADCAAVTQGVVVDMMQVCSLGVTTGLRIIDLTVEVSGTVGAAASEAGRLAFTNTVGSPPTAIVMVYGGASITPDVQAPAVFTFEPKICTPAAQFTIDIGGGGGATDAEVDSLVTLNFDSDPADQNSGQVQGWSYGVCIRDAGTMEVVAATVKGTDSGTFHGGTGPGFNSVNIYPGGVTHGVVIDLMATVTLPAQNGWTDLAVTWKILMDAEGQSTYVVPCDKTLGVPPVANVMVMGGNSFPASESAGIDPADDCCNPVSCNKAGLFVYQPGVKAMAGSANGDGRLDLADGIYILNYLFRGGPPLPCEKAGDANGDCLLDASDAVYIIHYQFLDGPPPVQGLGCVLFISDECPGLTCNVSEC